ncbi:MAG: electron transport complex subunit RsxG [Pseudomonadales bacterium]|nr:electron transport complex subunit RsxG [Pseudomonadales bacterium]
MIFTKPAREAAYRKRVGYQAGLLGGTCTIVATAIIGGHIATNEQVEAMLRADQTATLEQVIPTTLHDNNLLEAKYLLDTQTGELTYSAQNTTKAAPQSHQTIFIATTNGKVSALALPISGKGYGGDIDLILGVDSRGEILGVRTTGHKETPGLGDKIEETKDNWIYSFAGKSLSNTASSAWQVKKDGGLFDQFTGATITPRAVVAAVYQGLTLLQHHNRNIINTIESDQNANKVTTKSGSMSDAAPLNATKKVVHDE